MSNIAGFGDLKKNEGSTKKTNSTYAGGSQSGLAVEGRDPLQSIVDKAKE